MKKRILKNEYCFGLKWDDLSQDRSKAEIQAILDETDCKYGIHKNDESDSQQLGYTNNKSYLNSVSAAYTLYSLIDDDDYVFVEEIDEGIFWICGIMDGKIIGSTDIIVESSELIEEVEDVRNFFVDSNAEFRLFSEEKTSERLSNELGIESEKNISIFDLIEDSDSKIKSIIKNGKIKTKKGSSPLLLGLGGLIIAAGGTVFFISHQNNTSINEELLNQAEIILPESAIKKSQEEVTREALEIAYAEEVSWLKDKFEETDNINAINKIITANNQLPSFIAGWELSDIEFNSIKPKLIGVKANRTKFGTPITLKDGVANNKSLIINSENEATIIYSIGNKNKEVKIDDIIHYIHDGEYKSMEMAHDSHYFNYKFKSTPTKEKPRKEPIKGIADKKQANKSQLVLDSKDFTIKSKGINSLNSTKLIFERASTTIINKITFNRKDHIWSISGTIYENSK